MSLDNVKSRAEAQSIIRQAAMQAQADPTPENKRCVKSLIQEYDKIDWLVFERLVTQEKHPTIDLLQPEPFVKANLADEGDWEAFQGTIGTGVKKIYLCGLYLLITCADDFNTTHDQGISARIYDHTTSPTEYYYMNVWHKSPIKFGGVGNVWTLTLTEMFGFKIHIPANVSITLFIENLTGQTVDVQTNLYIQEI